MMNTTLTLPFFPFPYSHGRGTKRVGCSRDPQRIKKFKIGNNNYSAKFNQIKGPDQIILYTPSLFRLAWDILKNVYDLKISTTEIHGKYTEFFLERLKLIYFISFQVF